MQDHPPIVFFDGMCNFCNFWVKFILANETLPKLYFASLNSVTSKKILPQILADNFSTIIFTENGIIYRKSAAILKIARYLNYPYRMVWIFKIIPTFFSDKIYDFIAKNRYKWFGKSETCLIPGERIKARFLD